MQESKLENEPYRAVSEPYCTALFRAAPHCTAQSRKGGKQAEEGTVPGGAVLQTAFRNAHLQRSRRNRSFRCGSPLRQGSPQQLSFRLPYEAGLVHLHRPVP